MSRCLTFLGAPALVTALLGCGADAQNDTETDSLQFTELASGDYLQSGAFSNKSAEIISSQPALETAYATYSGTEVPQIDFTASKVLLVDMGRQPTGGYSIHVSSVTRDDGAAVAEVVLAQPGPECVVTEALTNPYQFVQIPTTGFVLVREELVADICE